MNTTTLGELQELLVEALESVTIRYGRSEQMSRAQYRTLLQKCRSVYSLDERLTIGSSRPEITNAGAKHKVLDIMNRELADHIRDGNILSATIAFAGGSRTGGSPVEDLLRNLLIRAIVDGPGNAAQAFADCTTKSSCTFYQFFLLTGVNVPEQVEIFDGITLIPVPSLVSRLPPYLPLIFPNSDRAQTISVNDLLGRTLVRVEYEVSPIFHRPAQNYTFQSGPEEHFKIKLKGQEIPDPNLDTLCQALSVAGRRSVKSVVAWTTLLDYEIFDLTSLLGIGGSGYSSVITDDIHGEPVQLSTPQLDTIKTIYLGLTELPTETWEKLRIPIDRWSKSIAEENPLDQIIDLGIALESLYVPDSQSEVSFRFALHAAWHLGENMTQRQELTDEFKQIYAARSDVVHTGKLRGKRSNSSFDVQKFVRRAQELCWQGIDKVIGAGEYPVWENLIMGEDLE